MVVLMGRRVSKGLIRHAKTPFMAMYMSEHEKGTTRPCLDIVLLLNTHIKKFMSLPASFVSSRIHLCPVIYTFKFNTSALNYTDVKCGPKKLLQVYSRRKKRL